MAFDVSFTLSVHDSRQLWAAAADRLLRTPELTEEDVAETIGTAEDPQIADCIAVLLAPPKLPGCLPERFDVQEASAMGCSGPVMLHVASPVRSACG